MHFKSSLSLIWYKNGRIISGRNQRSFLGLVKFNIFMNYEEEGIKVCLLHLQIKSNSGRQSVNTLEDGTGIRKIVTN